MKYLFLLALLCASSTNANNVLNTTDWINTQKMSQVLQKMNKNNLFPCDVQGRFGEQAGEMEFKASYCRFLPDMQWFYSVWGLHDSDYERYSKYYEERNFASHFHNTFVDPAGTTRHQVTWILMREKLKKPKRAPR